MAEHSAARTPGSAARKLEALAIVSGSGARSRRLSALLGKVDGITVAGHFGTVEEARRAGIRIDLLLVDLGRGGPPPMRVGEIALSPRETQVLSLLAAGCRDKDLPTKLEVSADSARTYLRRAMVKLGAASRTEAVARWISNGGGEAPDRSAGPGSGQV